MSDHGPYRDAATERCPVCAAPLPVVAAGEPRRCAGGCGEWVTATFVDERYGQAIEVHGDPFASWNAARARVACVICAQPMRGEFAPSWSLYRCGHHGVWFERDGRARFESVQVAAIGQHRAERMEAAQMVALVTDAVTGDPAAVRALANRLLELERALRRLREGGVPV